ncbi:DMT family transporter [Lutibaculum baratangense]|uniref:Permease of the drug/metabolite transporter (DMT) superfamily n=1 Tax=Lutibaculum baratangense AMV1 TaxID=631454 RepID=V4RPZ3_9HYPH|nr:EamA family transporter [Lutibaculum baratangense]ESR27344.1 Permease of the drug/metabolite transporter (DMT) superfamily [Lutibaculum baratangense AMV1]
MTPAQPVQHGFFPPSHLGLLLLVQLIWGANFVVSKLAVTDLPPLMFIATRFFVVWLLMLPFMRWHPGQMGNVLAIAFLAGAGHFAAMILSLAWADDIGPIAIGLQLGPPISTVLSVVFLGERLGPWRLAAIVIAFGGVALMGFDPTVLEYWPALLMVIVAALSMAVAQIFMRMVRGVSVYDMQAWVGFGTWPPIFALSLLMEDQPVARLLDASLYGWAAVAFTAVGVSLVGHGGFYWILQRHEITRVAPFALLAPVFGAVLGIVLLGDVVTWRIVVGGLLTLSGVFIITVREGRRRQAPPPVTSRT